MIAAKAFHKKEVLQRYKDQMLVWMVDKARIETEKLSGLYTVFASDFKYRSVKQPQQRKMLTIFVHCVILRLYIKTVSDGGGFMHIKYMSSTEAAEKWGLSVRQVQRLIADGRIEGCQKLGNKLLLPGAADKPENRHREKK